MLFVAHNPAYTVLCVLLDDISASLFRVVIARLNLHPVSSYYPRTQDRGTESDDANLQRRVDYSPVLYVPYGSLCSEAVRLSEA